MISRNIAAVALASGHLVGACASIDGGVPVGAPRRIVATDGTTWDGVAAAAQQAGEAEAVVTSAAHDIPCAREEVRLVRVIEGDAPRSYVTEGCGARLTYSESTAPARLPSGEPRWVCSFLLLARVGLTEGPAMAPRTAP